MRDLYLSAVRVRQLATLATLLDPLTLAECRTLPQALTPRRIRLCI